MSSLEDLAWGHHAQERVHHSLLKYSPRACALPAELSKAPVVFATALGRFRGQVGEPQRLRSIGEYLMLVYSTQK